MWQKAASAAGFPFVVASAGPSKTVASTRAPFKRKHKKKRVVAKPAPSTPPTPN
jgi:hypothetical protein